MACPLRLKVDDGVSPAAGWRRPKTADAKMARCPGMADVRSAACSTRCPSSTTGSDRPTLTSSSLTLSPSLGCTRGRPWSRWAAGPARLRSGRGRRRLLAHGGAARSRRPPSPGAACASFENVQIDTSTFEEWNDQGRRFDLLVAAASWHWVDASVGWPRAHAILRPGGWMALILNIVVRRPGEPEVYAESADLHERYCPGNPDWGHPPLEDEVRTTNEGWGEVVYPGRLFGPTIVRWYPFIQWFDGAGFADLLRSTSLYRRLDPETREPLLNAIAERIRTQMGDRAPGPSPRGAPCRTACWLTAAWFLLRDRVRGRFDSSPRERERKITSEPPRRIDPIRVPDLAREVARGRFGRGPGGCVVPGGRGRDSNPRHLACKWHAGALTR